MTWLIVGMALALVLVGPVLYMNWYFGWESAQTSGMRYYGRSLVERQALKRRIRLLSRPVLPLVKLLASTNQKNLALPAFEFEGIFGPKKIASPEIFERARRYQPRPEDVFVATQMRCGTTWMQQIVFQTVTRGRGDLSETGFGHLYRMSPWIDASITVSMDEAPVVGERPTRVIKTHLPTALCPYAEHAKYIYVTRHPVSCFASIVDYNRSLLGPLMPPIPALADWYCSDRMFWLPWPQHVEGWWAWAASRPNVLFVHYEEMTRDFAATLGRVAAFLGVDLSDAERRTITEKCSFAYMKKHEELFEMAPPSMFSVTGGEYLKSGKESRHEDVTAEIRQQILDYCRAALGAATYPATRYYPDLGPQTANRP